MRPRELKERIKGICHLVTTPFDENEDLDEKALRESVRHVANELKGEDAVFVPTGSTGEFYAMTDEECKKVAQIVVEEVNGEFPVIVGTGRAGTKATIEMSQHAQDVGADGVMIILPYYHLVTKEGLYRHYKAIAESLDIGIMIYNNPVTSKLWIPPDLMVRLSKIENIIADKENSPNPMNYYEMQRAVDPEDMVIVCGLGQFMYQFWALYGCPGFFTELANYGPKMAVDIYKAATQRDFDKLTELLDKMAPLNQFRAKLAQRRGALPTILSPHITEAAVPFYVSICKEAMNSIGLRGGQSREPMDNITAQEKEELRDILRDIGLL